MTAYRSGAAPADVPYVNPHLERALLEYYAKEHRRNIVPFAVLVGITLLVVGWVVVFHPEGALRIAPIGVVGGPCAFAALITGFELFRAHPQHMLDRIRTGIPIRRVESDTRIPTIRVEFADGSAAVLPPLGDLRHLARVEHLLVVQMELGSVSRLRAS